MSEAEQQPATVAPPSEQSADAAEATAESAPAENPPTDGPPADGVPAEGQKPAAPVSEEEAAVVTEVVAAAVIAVAADENSPKSAEQSEAIDSPPKAEEPPKEEEPPREEPPRQEERPEVVVPPEGNQQPAAPPNEQAGDVEPPQPPAHVVEERPQEAAEEVESIDEEPPLDRVPLPLVPRSHELEHAEEEYRRQQQAQFELKANRVEGERVPFQFAERRAEDLWEDDEPPQRAPVEAEQDEQGANAEAEVVAELPPTPPSLEAQDEAASTRSLAGSLAGSELRVDAALKPEDAPADPAANDEKPPAEEASKPESPKAEGDEPKDVADSKSKDEKPPEAQEPAKIEPPVPERQDSWDDGFPRDAKPAARPSQDLVDPWASDPEDSPPAARKISTVAAEDAWGDDVPAVTAAQWNAAPDPEPKKFEENRNFSSPSHNARGGGHFGGSSRGEPSGRGGLGARGRGSYDEQPARNNFQRSNGRGDGHRAEENFRSDRHSSAYDEPPKHQPAHNAGNNQRSYGGRGGRDGGGWDDNRTAQRPNDRPHFPQHANNFNDDNRQSTGGYAGGGRGEANGGYNSQNQRSFGGHLQANERFEDERQHQSAPYHQQDRQQQHQSYDQAPHKRQSEAKVNDWLHDQQSQNAHSQDARSQHRQQFEYRRSGNEQRGNASEWGNRSTGSGQRGGGAYERDEYRNSNVQGGRQPADDRHHQQQHQSYGSQQRGDDQWNTSNSYENSKPFGGNGDHARHEPRGHFRSNDYEQQPPNGDRNRGFGQSEGGFRDFGRGQDNNNREYPRDGNRDYQRENRGEFDRRSQFSGGANERGRNEYSRSGHEQPQEGEAPSFRHTLFGGYVAKDRPAHEPSFRSTDEIFEDDEQKKDRYAVIADEDGGVVVHNMPHNEEVQVMDTWKDAMLDETIVANVTRAGYPRPRNFQRYAFPVIYDGRDLMGQAETGAGKSVAFLLPLIQKLSQEFKGTNKVERLHRCAVLVIEPTRELAIQLYEQAKKLAVDTPVSVNVAYGEYKISQNKNKIHLEGCDILIGTPGRLYALMLEGFIKYQQLQYFVLDEADELIRSMHEEITAFVSLPGFPPPEKRQTLFFAATFSPELRTAGEEFCRPKAIVIRNKMIDLNKRVFQQVLQVPYNDRFTYLIDYLKEIQAENQGTLPKTMIFVDTRANANSLTEQVCAAGIECRPVHSDRTQQEREEFTRLFRNGKIAAIVTTNVCGRGLDINDLNRVVNVYVPNDRETYVNRIGRTGRVETGHAITFFDPDEPKDQAQAHMLVEAMNKVRQPVPDFLKDAAALYSQMEATDDQ